MAYAISIQQQSRILCGFVDYCFLKEYRSPPSSPFHTKRYQGGLLSNIPFSPAINNGNVQVLSTLVLSKSTDTSQSEFPFLNSHLPTPSNFIFCKLSDGKKPNSVGIDLAVNVPFSLKINSDPLALSHLPGTSFCVGSWPPHACNKKDSMTITFIVFICCLLSMLLFQFILPFVLLATLPRLKNNCSEVCRYCCSTIACNR